MKTQELFDILANKIADKIQTSHGLTKFAQRRAKFEGWLKVEIIDILGQQEIHALPEIERIDVTFDNVCIELKTVNTNIGYDNVVRDITRPITKNTNSIIKDIEKLSTNSYQDKFVLFIVFPVEHNNPFWQKQLRTIKTNLSELIYKESCFKNEVPFVVYLGKI